MSVCRVCVCVCVCVSVCLCVSVGVAVCSARTTWVYNECVDVLYVTGIEIPTCNPNRVSKFF